MNYRYQSLFPEYSINAFGDEQIQSFIGFVDICYNINTLHNLFYFMVIWTLHKNITIIDFFIWNFYWFNNCLVLIDFLGYFEAKLNFWNKLWVLKSGFYEVSNFRSD